MATPERLAEVDAQLAALGKGDDELAALRARVAGEGARALDEVDATLAELASDLEGAGELLRKAGERVPAVVGTFAKGAAAPPPEARSAQPPPPPPSTSGSAEPPPPPGSEPARESSDEIFQEAPWGEGGSEPHSLSADDLFGDTADGSDSRPLTSDPALSEPPPAPEAEAARGGGVDEGLADLLEGDEAPAAPAAEADAGVDPNLDFSESTDMMSAEEVEAIRNSVPPGQAAADDAGEVEIEVLDTDDFELLVDDEDLGG